MNARTPETTSARPQLIGSLRRGFDTVASHIGLILLPVLLDLFLWLGPHYGIKSVAAAIQNNLTALISADSQFTDLVRTNQQIWQMIGERFNLAILMRSFPVGLPSLMAGRVPVETPFGQALYYQITSTGETLLWMLAFSLAGLALGSQYFSSVARIVARGSANVKYPNPGRSILQVILLTTALVAILGVLTIPAFILLSILALVNPAITQIGLLIYMVFILWILLPLFFAPHGIFLFSQNALSSMLTSMRLVRFILPVVSMFIMVIILLSQGLDILWESPALTSWFSLVGIAGHAFITTSLVAASFVFYQDSIQWVQEVLQRSLLKKEKSAQA